MRNVETSSGVPELEGRRALFRRSTFLLVEYYGETIARVADAFELTGECRMLF